MTLIFLFALQVVPPFMECADAVGLSFQHGTNTPSPGEPHAFAPGIAVADFDRNGWQDVFVAGGAGQNGRLFLNHAGLFVDRAREWRLDLVKAEGTGAIAGDVDGDGWLDLYVTTIDGPNFLFRNTGQGFFDDVSTKSGAVLRGDRPFNSHGSTFGDVDNDGHLDLVTLDWDFPATGGDLLFVNNGFGQFSEQTRNRGLFPEFTLPRGFTPSVFDMDRDGYSDVLVAGDFGTSEYYAGGAKGFFELLEDNGTGTDENGMGSALGDFDNDGDLDWFVTSIFDEDGMQDGNWGITGNRLYRNEGNHQYVDATDLAGVRDGMWGWGCSFADYNNDGLLDLAMTNGFIIPGIGNPDPTFLTDPSRLWINTGDFLQGPSFVEASEEAGIVDLEDGKGLVSFDADHDGDLDLLVSGNNAPLRYFRNEHNPSRQGWIQFDLLTPEGLAPDGVGSLVRLQAGSLSMTRPVFGNPSFLSQEPLRVHFGFPPVKSVTATVEWPDGRQDVYSGLKPGRLHRLAPQPRSLPRSRNPNSSPRTRGLFVK